MPQTDGSGGTRGTARRARLRRPAPSWPRPRGRPARARQRRALDVAGGAGRNALWLARRGASSVTLADVSDVARHTSASRAGRRGRSNHSITVRTDLEAEPLPAGPWDLVLCTYFLHRPLFAAFPSALAPGGWLLFAPRDPEKSGGARPPRPRPRPRDGELGSLVRGLDVVRLDEGWFEEGRHEAAWWRGGRRVERMSYALVIGGKGGRRFEAVRSGRRGPRRSRPAGRRIHPAHRPPRDRAGRRSR